MAWQAVNRIAIDARRELRRPTCMPVSHFLKAPIIYFVISDAWELRALQALLLSRLTRLIISTYSTKMRGRFDALNPCHTFKHAVKFSIH